MGKISVKIIANAGYGSPKYDKSLCQNCYSFRFHFGVVIVIPLWSRERSFSLNQDLIPPPVLPFYSQLLLICFMMIIQYLQIDRLEKVLHNVLKNASYSFDWTTQSPQECSFDWIQKTELVLNSLERKKEDLDIQELYLALLYTWLFVSVAILFKPLTWIGFRCLEQKTSSVHF